MDILYDVLVRASNRVQGAVVENQTRKTAIACLSGMRECVTACVSGHESVRRYLRQDIMGCRWY